MPTYRIVCTNQQPVDKQPKHAHIVAVGVGVEPTKYTQTYTLAQVLQMMTNGDKFYTQSVKAGKTAWVEPYTCSSCNQRHIKSAADAVTDNNLDHLPYCQR